jgi:Zn-dependent protease
VLSCPQCRRLTHGSELEELAKRARAAWRVGKFSEERELWAQSCALLPEDTVQHRSIQARIAEIDRQSSAGTPSGGDWKKASMGIVPALVLLLSKGKFLLLGLTKLGTLLTMLASLGVYWGMYGWALALGIVISIYIHEMGHVAAIRRYGLPATAPMFIPGLGAFIRLRGVRLPPIPDARVGLAGPVYGFGAALAALAIYQFTHVRIWGVIANFGATINLFNLIPVWQLDGSRGLHSLTRWQRGAVLSTAVVLWLITSNPMLLLISLAGAVRMFSKDCETEPDHQGLALFAGLLVALSLMVAVSNGTTATAKSHAPAERTASASPQAR